jgi:hypothetical protein
MGLRKRPGRGGVGSGTHGGGGALGLIGLGKGSPDTATPNQAVSPEMADASGGGGYYGQNGQVTEKPFTDTRNFWQKYITRQPNAAGQLNNQIAFGTALQQAQIPGNLQQAKGMAAIDRASALQELQDKGSYEQAQTADTNPLFKNPELANVTEPGDVPYSYSVDPQKAIYDRAMPFVGDTLGGKKANAGYTENILNSDIRTKEAQANHLAAANADIFRKQGTFPTNTDLTPTEGERSRAVSLARAPSYTFTHQGNIFRTTPEGDLGLAGQEYVQPEMTLNPTTKKYEINPNKGQPAVRGIQPLATGLPYSAPSADNLKGAASTQVQKHPIAPGQEGGPPPTTESVGGAPKTQPTISPEDIIRPAPLIRSYPGRSSGGISKPEYQGSGANSLTVEPTEYQQLLERIRMRRALQLGNGPKY